ncbi:TetR/AcrR family transcriptional regulator [Hamadaea tsunoensis]|uniref:TetR/AcrR family transcriptional regulator n=1 Tax=Hamadaea tsunoensis TaxID=53368 RepID=UPI000412AE25|nr:TetR/AcrR family transcriptional regulator [Hamadaea tsunoensis]
MSSEPGARRADAVRNRGLALDAAKQLLAQPEAQLTVEKIAQRAGLGAGTVVRAFGGKDALLDAAVAELLTPIVARGRELAATPDEAALRTFLVELSAFQREHYAISEQIAGLSLPATAALEAELGGVLRDLLAAGRAAGRIRTDIALETAVVLVGEAAHAVARARKGPGDLGAAFVTVLLDGLRPPSGASTAA